MDLPRGWNDMSLRKPPRNVLVELLFETDKSCIGYRVDETLWFDETRKVLKEKPIAWRAKSKEI